VKRPPPRCWPARLFDRSRDGSWGGRSAQPSGPAEEKGPEEAAECQIGIERHRKCHGMPLSRDRRSEVRDSLGGNSMNSGGSTFAFTMLNGIGEWDWNGPAGRPPGCRPRASRLRRSGLNRCATAIGAAELYLKVENGFIMLQIKKFKYPGPELMRKMV
jgi:hypothetical protein